MTNRRALLLSRKNFIILAAVCFVCILFLRTYSFDHDFIYHYTEPATTSLKKINAKKVTGSKTSIGALGQCTHETLKFIANTTDVTDECIGMRKAFASSCSDQALSLNDKKMRRKRRQDRKDKRAQQIQDGVWRRKSIEDLSSTDEIDDGSIFWSFFPLKARGLTTDNTNDDPEVSLLAIQPTKVDENSSQIGTGTEYKDQYKENEYPLREKSDKLENENIRACCSSIVRNYHENCDDTGKKELSDKRLGFILFAIVVCGLVKSLIRNFELNWLTEAGGCILVGVVAGVFLQYLPHLQFGFDETFFLRVMLPPIVFQASLAIDKPAFVFHWIPIMVFAVLGTIVSTALTAMIVHHGSAYLGTLCPTIPLVESYAFGALISSIDPIATLSILSSLGIDEADTIYVLVFGESLLNDGVAVVLFNTLIHFMDDHMIIDSKAIWNGALNFMVVTIGSVSVGLLCGSFSVIYFRAFWGCQTPLVEVLVFFCWALIPFYICDDFEWSGIVAIVVAGFMMDLYILGAEENEVKLLEGTSNEDEESCKDSNEARNQDRQRRPVFNRAGHLSSATRRHVGFVLECIATLMETAIFAYLGLFLFSTRYNWNIYLAATAIFACLVSRGIMLVLMSFITQQFASCINGRKALSDNRRESSPSSDDNTGKVVKKKIQKRHFYSTVDNKIQLVLWFSGLRGA